MPQSFTDNASEVFSGVGASAVPSAVSAFHHMRSPSSVAYSADDIDENDPDFNSDLASEEGASFRFFSLQDIEQAQGVSSLAAVDYDTDWEDDASLHGSEHSYHRGSGNDLSRRTSSAHLLGHEDDVEMRRYDSVNSSSDDLQDYAQAMEETKFQRAEDKLFTRFPCKTHNQRFYLAEEDLVVGIAGYQTRLWSLICYNILCVLTFGVLALLVRWFPKWRISFLGEPSPLSKSQWVVVEDEYGFLEILPIERQFYNHKLSTYLTCEKDSFDPTVPILISFQYRYMKFFFDPLDDLFKVANNWVDQEWSSSNIEQDGIDNATFLNRKLIFGKNLLEIKKKPIIKLLIEEILHPFYVFQLFSIILWLADNYYYYAFCILLISVLSISQSLLETKATLDKMSEMALFECPVIVWRESKWHKISSVDLVPGDIYQLSQDLGVLPCDSLLISGECIINESMLTGESVPVSKLPISLEIMSNILNEFNFAKFSPQFAKSFLFNGTKLVRVRQENEESPALAMVIRIGFNTTKGSLVRSMLFPKPTSFKFYNDSFKYIGFMSIIACCGFVVSAYNFIQLGLPMSVIILRALDLITIVVPPALPATLTIGTNLALNRLKSMGIFCIAPQRVNIGGKVDICVFDKTGTLTEDGLNVNGVHISQNGKFSSLITDADNSEIGDILDSMVNCHSLKIIHGERMGDPLDENMFTFTRWQMIEEQFNNGKIIFSKGNQKWEFVKEFEFESSLRRMSVISSSSDNYTVFVKGAPEVIKPLCISNIPDDFDELLHHYTHEGYRVIATASKNIKKIPSNRNECESELKFTGFIIFENKLKDQTNKTILELKNANIGTVMCTGDNLLTAINVGRKAGMVDADEQIYIANMDQGYLEWTNVNDPQSKLDPLSLTPVKYEKYSLGISGDIFKYIITELPDSGPLKQMLLKGSIFARMSPDEKNELVNQLKKIDHTVCFCGDGANDCGALKAADVGISLSEAEASVAAPFTSQVFEISCVLSVIKEGRASLVTSFSCFQYMSLYSAIQFISVTFLYLEGINLGDFQFLYIDLVLIIPLAVFMSWSGPSKTLVKKRPSANLVSPKIILPLLGDIVLLYFFQLFIWEAIGLLQNEDWYIPAIPGNDENVNSTDNTILFFFANFQYILIALKLTKGKPYREPVFTNVPFLLTVLVTVGLSVGLMFLSIDSWLGDRMSLVWVPGWIKFWLFPLGILNYLVMMLLTPVFLWFSGFWKKTTSSKRYKRLSNFVKEV